MDLHVEPCQKVDGKIENTIGEDDIKQRYKPISKNELWASMWLVNFVGTCLYPTMLFKYVHAFIKFAQMKDVFVCDLGVAIKVYQGDLYNMYLE